MPVNVTIRPVIPDDIPALMAGIREADRREIEAAATCSPEEAVRASLAMSHAPRAGLVNGTLACLYGVGTLHFSSGVGAPWLVATRVMERVPMTFLRRCREQLAMLHEGFRVLENYVDARNDVAIHWLRWLGFRMDAPAPYGRLGLPFHRFHMGG